MPIAKSAVFLLCLPLFAAAPDDGKIALADRVLIASQVYAAIPIYFAHWKGVPNLDLDAEYKACLKAILATDDRREFDVAMMEFVAKLSNGHTWFGDWWLRNTRGQAFGFFAHPIDGRWAVTETSIADLHIGDVIETIDGEPIGAFYRRFRKYLFASDERWRERDLFESPFFFPSAFDLTLDNGRTIHIARSKPFSWHGDEFTGDVIRREEDVAILRIPSFSKPIFEDEAVKAIRGLGAVRALILDLRGNHGGTPPGQLLGALMDRPYRSWSEETPQNIGMFQTWGVLGNHAVLGWSGGVSQPRPAAYKGPLYLLTDSGCYSACEDFAMPLKDSRRAIVIGERTAGSAGQQYVRDFGNGMALGVATRRLSFPDGAPFEGVGIAPDVEIHTGIEDLRAGRDPVLAKAVELSRAAGR